LVLEEGIGSLRVPVMIKKRGEVRERWGGIWRPKTGIDRPKFTCWQPKSGHQMVSKFHKAVIRLGRFGGGDWLAKSNRR
jgi:hypothetical protein